MYQLLALAMAILHFKKPQLSLEEKSLMAKEDIEKALTASKAKGKIKKSTFLEKSIILLEKYLA